jgi:hypothetical protein
MVESEVWFDRMGPIMASPLETTMLQSSGIAIRITSRTFLVIDLVGLHASFRGHEIRLDAGEYGWVRG